MMGLRRVDKGLIQIRGSAHIGLVWEKSLFAIPYLLRRV